MVELIYSYNKLMWYHCHEIINHSLKIEVISNQISPFDLRLGLYGLDQILRPSRSIF